MKKYIILFFSLILVLCFSSCSLISDLPDTVTIDEKEYTRAFISEFFPVSKSLVNNNGVRVSGHIYYEYSNTPFDCYIAYGNDGFPNVYFESSAFNEAFSYYTDLNNLKFFCLFGNVHDENKQKIIEIEEIDIDMFNSLLEYSIENNYNPLTSFNNEEGLKSVPIPDPDNWVSDEIHLYKESKDGAFTTSRGYIFKLIDNQLYLLYRYDFRNDESPAMILRDIPKDISDYFCSLVKKLQNK